MNIQLAEIMKTLEKEDYQTAYSLAKKLENEGSWAETDSYFINYTLCVAGRHLGLYEESIKYGEKIINDPFILGSQCVSRLWLALAFSNYLLFKQTKYSPYLKSALKYGTISKQYQTKSTKAETTEIVKSIEDCYNQTMLKDQHNLKTKKTIKTLSLIAKLLLLLALFAGMAIFALEWLR